MTTKKTKTTKTTKKVYDQNSIQHYEGLEGVRKRPTMYIGKLGTIGVFHLFRETIDNSIDEFMEGHCSEIFVDVDEKTNTIMVKDNARGIPTEKLEQILTKLHTGGKFDSESYKFSSGLNGVGLKCVNALSDMFRVIVERDGKKVEVEYSQGKKVKDLKVLGKSKNTGTTVIFHPDVEVMEEIDIEIAPYLEHCEMLSYLNKGIEIKFHAIRRDGSEVNKTFKSEQGLFDLLHKMDNKLITKPQLFELNKSDLNLDDDKQTNVDYRVTIAMAYSNSEEENVVSFCNSIKTTEGGSHIEGLRRGLSAVLPTYIRENKLITKKDESLELTGDDTREGLVAVIVAKHTDPLFDSQTKDKLTNKDVTVLARKVIVDCFKQYLEENKADAKLIAQKVILAAKSRTAAKKVREVNKRTSSTFNLNSITKYVDCANTYPDYRELFVVEGDSAGASLNDGRDPHTQAIYKLRGKPLNTFDKSVTSILNNKEISDLTQIIGCGIGKSFDIKNFKFNRIIIAADSDIDGYDIKSLITGFFFRFMPELIEQGYIYYACAPLYKINEGKKQIYIETKKDYNEYIYKRILKEFNLYARTEDGATKVSNKDFINLLNKQKQYMTLVDEISLKLCCPSEVVEKMALSYSTKSFEKYIAPLKVVQRGKVQVVEGLTECEEYVCVVLDDTVRTDLDRVKRFFKEEIKTAQILYTTKNENKVQKSTLVAFYDMVFKKCTPDRKQRYKGLGEMNADQLWDTTLNPDTRTLIQLTMDDAEEALKELDIQLGKDADKRKVSIRDNEHTIEVEDLDR